MADSAKTKMPAEPVQIDKEKIKKAFDVSNFDFNAVLRGMQLTLVGAHRALQNPAIFTSEHYRQALYAVGAGIAIRLAIAIPILGIKVLLWVLSFVFRMDGVTWDDKLVDGLNFVGEYVLQVPLFLMSMMRLISPTLDNLFMDSLRWVDLTYVQKHKRDNPDELRDMYYPNMRMYKQRDGSTNSTSTAEASSMFIWRFARKAFISLAMFALSYVPVIGRFVLPAASFYTFKKAVGLGPASVIFGTGVLMPRKYLIIFLQTYFSSRNLMRELLEPYFSRIHMTKEQKKRWFRTREGILFGFGIGFYILLRVPLLGVLIYGIAEASTAYLITKITDPPPPPSELAAYVESQKVWKNKHEFLSLSLGDLDALQMNKSVTASSNKPPPYSEQAPGTGNSTGMASHG
ncbi:hypothetical protein MCOR27_004014 [Pyricularia oryzae]|uniref:Transmembrane protein UsgS n=4 Tax=Pyricularia TaxID=48558 RepID=A0ABQ8N2H5_PYRGI|nr:uncharacterized protein MGG_17078 [Pyricularia oryzae 70-15]KAH8844197.1 hypothetical protein MCOR01_004965 [Pyricularia oryzae]KAI6290126.1 hypothetical protein MCOR33_011503 [Pyricularia grisea]EHA50064.1 hypothetical protein MGG_17078 [Pyricularia oryzae 70-15]KAH9431711.1 hypothetical protein MCOR02_008997 [Pyricularia oryzae]KAI6252860.1 hypothetical protein MCOR19_010550 [Pyricularia oryzae]